MQVCAGRTALAKISVRFAPGVFTVPLRYPAAITAFGNAPAGVDLDDIVAVVGIFVSIAQLCPECIITVLRGVSYAQKLVQLRLQGSTIAIDIFIVAAKAATERGKLRRITGRGR